MVFFEGPCHVSKEAAGKLWTVEFRIKGEAYPLQAYLSKLKKNLQTDKVEEAKYVSREFQHHRVWWFPTSNEWVSYIYICNSSSDQSELDRAIQSWKPEDLMKLNYGLAT